MIIQNWMSNLFDINYVYWKRDGNEKMKYEEIREMLCKIADENYRDYVKAIISIETSINDEKILDEIFEKFMESDSVQLINDEIETLVE